MTNILKIDTRDEKNFTKNIIKEFVDSVVKNGHMPDMLEKFEIDYVRTFNSNKHLLNIVDPFKLMFELTFEAFGKHKYPRYSYPFDMQCFGNDLIISYSVTEYPDLYAGFKNEIEEYLENDEDYEGSCKINNKDLQEIYENEFPEFYENTMSNDFSKLVETIKEKYLKENK